MCCCSYVSFKSCTQDVDDLQIEIKVAIDSHKKTFI